MALKKNVTLYYHEAIFFVKFPLILRMKISLVIYQTISSNLQVPYHKNLFTSKQTSAAHFLSHEIKPSPHAFNSIAGSCFQLSLFLDHAFDEKVVVYTFRSLNLSDLLYWLRGFLRFLSIFEVTNVLSEIQ